MNMVILLLWALVGVPDPSIGEINRLKKAAAVAWQAGRYTEALAHYDMLIDSLGVSTPLLQANRAHAYFAAQDSTQALRAYQQLFYQSHDNQLRGMALNQIGLLSEGKISDKELLSFFKRALKEDHTNETARYNYQRIAQRIKDDTPNKQEDQSQQQQDQDQSQQQQDQSQQQQDQDQSQQQQDQDQSQQQQDQDQSQQQDQDQSQQQDPSQQQEDPSQQQQDQDQQQQDPSQQQEDESQQQQDQPQQPGEAQDTPQDPDETGLPQVPSTADKLRAMNLSEEKARQILDALRQQEIQYLQQVRRKATKPKDDTKPDW